MLSASQLASLLSGQGLRLSRRLGQHHLVDGRIIEQLIEVLNLSGCETVLEIGAGLGALTEPLASRAKKVIAVEIDRKVASLLRKRLSGCGNITFIAQDILSFPWGHYRDLTVVGAIPYSLTSPIIVLLSENRQAIKDVWLIMQYEVAQRLLAKPGTKDYGRTSILGQYCWQMTQVMTIPPAAFFPRPRVRSSCLHFVPHRQPPACVTNEAAFFAVVKSAFGQRRKMLINCLAKDGKANLKREEIERLLGELGLSRTVRGEALSLAQFANFSNALERLKSLRS